MKTIDIWNFLEDEYKKNPGWFGVPVENDKLIQEDQKILGLSFSKTYIMFLKKFGGYMGDGHVVYGLIPQSKGSCFDKSVIDRTDFFKKTQNWPDIKNWYIISDDGSGNPIGVDPEGKVWLSDHGAGFEHIKLADSFEEFLYKLYTETLYE